MDTSTAARRTPAARYRPRVTPAARVAIAPVAITGADRPRRLSHPCRHWHPIVAVAAALAVSLACDNAAEEALAAGNLLHNQGEHDRARDAYRRAIAADPRNPLAHVSLGNALMELRDFEGAGRAFSRALELNRASAAAHRGMMRLISHTALPGDRIAFARYLGHAEELIAQRPRDVGALTNAGILLSEAANRDNPETYAEAQYRAEEYLGRALAQAPDDPRGLFHLALVHARQQRPEAALAAVRRLEKLRVRPGLATYAAAAVHAITGDRLRALAAAESLLRDRAVDPDELTHPTSYVAPLRGDPRFEALLAAARAGRAMPE